ncbi:ATP-binding cassette domain-containing protein [Loktanella sp. SALINAS62]|uniref:thiamine ABC transporter ATP-binding protein n=1 Tax=Loktanella sp. SALINAS62 TaxID=2706124 RepID=UPI001B8BBF9A|nr:ATP-binding cassette domain-containing protein [Loktanella sp. SALINAS62]MBS1302265.1 ATP-binding cassette domain-containing protein [Loktanella sp. SALINAS62]
MLTCDDLTLRQGAFTLRADWSLSPGLTAVIGPSGGGKSTLLSAIAGFLDPASGCVLWDGRNLSGAAPGNRPVTMLFQDNNLFPHLTVAQNAGLGLVPSLRLTKDHSDRVAVALDRVGLAGLGDRKPNALSGGQQSRAALARVLLADRPVVLLDEAFAALGPALRAQMLELVQSILVAAGRTVLMVTHDPADAQNVADNVILVSDGYAHPPQDTGALFADPSPELRRYLGT